MIVYIYIYIYTYEYITYLFYSFWPIDSPDSGVLNPKGACFSLQVRLRAMGFAVLLLNEAIGGDVAATRHN